MNTCFKYIALSVAALALGLSAFAQNLPDGVYEGKNGIAYKKSSSLKPGTTDTYVVNLEAFVYGQVTVKNVSVPADIVLVLDVSGSMDETIYGAPYTAQARKAYSYNNFGDNNLFYKHTDGKYYRVNTGVYRDGTLAWWAHFYLYINVNGTVYYLYGTGIQTNRPTDPRSGGWGLFGNGDTIWTGVLYTGTNLGSKLDVLKTAVNAFIDQIRYNDLYDNNDERRLDDQGNETALGNQISIVKFAMDSYYNSTAGYNSNSAPTTEGNHRNNNGYNYTEVVKGFIPTEAEANVTTLKNAVEGLVAGGATAGDYGLNLARLLLESIKNTRTESSKTVVFFTDGSPTYASDFNTNVASYAISNSYSIKHTYNAKVFSVGVFDELGEDADNVNTYMNGVSSNYPDARQFTQLGNPETPAQMIYYQEASGANLTSVFTTIAELSGGSGNTEVTGEAAVTVDVVASSFSLPDNISEDDITVLVAPCNVDEETVFQDIGNGKVRFSMPFGEEKTPSSYGLPSIDKDVDAANNMVSTSGFDFSGNWCGLGAPHGYKQIIRFEIKLKDDAVGGPNVVTNDRRSGIYVNGSPVAQFNRPTVKVPVSLWIVKKGLSGEDSAVFNVQYANYQEGVDPRTLDKSAWKSFTKVIVNCNSPLDYTDVSGTYPMVKLVGLDPDYFYRIKEDAWAWTYTYVDQGTQYAYGEDQKNPFVFINNPIANIKSAEATVQNIFNEKSE